MRRRRALSVGALLLSVALVGVGAGTAQASEPVTSPRPSLELPAPPVLGQPTRPDQDSFYRPPSDLDRGEPGDLIRSRVSHVRASVLPAPVRAWQVLYRSTSARDESNAVSGTVMVPGTPWLGSGPRPIVTYTIGTHGLGDQCAPSYQLASGTDVEFTLMSQALAAGWAVVVTDYEGLGTPGNHTYVVQRSEGRAALDIVRAATELRDAGLSRNAPVGIWGYSQGGGAAASAAEQAEDYASDLKVVGVAEGGVPADLRAVGRNLDNKPSFGLLAAAAAGIDAGYPDLDIYHDLLNDKGRKLIDRVRTECTEELAGEGTHRLNEFTTVDDPLDYPPLVRKLEVNRIGAQAPRVPVRLYQAGADELIPVDVAHKLRDEYCGRGVRVQYTEIPAANHVAGALSGGPGSVAWLAERFAGHPAPNSCG
ncbi:lipase family protein [Pseudonocardia spinosispora]|uniref:lipase family protein n=1 Tax=Pseudonocardia spinosispora TaxID=103441 RepID=UPI00041115C6|nr:lipase family protein [Pseudonocardia spinosispora]